MDLCQNGDPGPIMYLDETCIIKIIRGELIVPMDKGSRMVTCHIRGAKVWIY